MITVIISMKNKLFIASKLYIFVVISNTKNIESIKKDLQIIIVYR